MTTTVNFEDKKRAAANKNFMSNVVSVRLAKSAARNNSIRVRQERNLQSPTAYSSEHYQ